MGRLHQAVPVRGLDSHTVHDLGTPQRYLLDLLVSELTCRADVGCFNLSVRVRRTTESYQRTSILKRNYFEAFVPVVTIPAVKAVAWYLSHGVTYKLESFL